jgi:hypothetical protein
MIELDFNLIIHIASICHEASKAWGEANGYFYQKSWEETEDWLKESTVAGVVFRLSNPDAAPSVMHDNWCNDKISQGWVYGETKDDKKKTHPCLVPFEELPLFQQKKDKLFSAIVDALK